MEFSARDTGAYVVGREMAVLVDRLGTPLDLARSPELEPALDQALDSLRTDGYTPTHVLLPHGWPIVQAVSIERSTRYGGPVVPPHWMPPDTHHAVVGRRGSTWYVQIFDRAWPDDLAAAVDLAAYGRWLQPAEEGEQLKISLESFSEDAAREVLAQQPNAELSSRRLRDVELSVRVRVDDHFAVRIDDAGAVRWIGVPPDLRA
jgi:hypothetical protein